MSMEIQVQDPRGRVAPSAMAVPGPEQIQSMAQALRLAQPAWAQATPEHRVAVLGRWKEALAEQGTAVVRALAQDTGRSLLATVEHASSMARIDYWSQRAPGLLQQTSQGVSETAPSVRYEHQRLPFGLVGVISPWNFPLLLTLTDAIPALAAGCAVLAKPSEITPRFIEPLMASINAVPELAAVFQVVPGDGAVGGALLNQVDAVCFTGSVATGRSIGRVAGERLIPAFLELGGKDPLIVLPGTDLAQSAAIALRSSAISTGQACQSIERIYVPRAEHDRFVEQLVSLANQVELNLEDIAQGQLGPFIDGRQADKVDAQIQDAQANGATLHCGGVVRSDGGAWCAPAVLTGVDHSMQIQQEETFGPVMPVMPYDTVEDAISLANDTEFGLSAAVLGPNEAEAIAVARQINAGAVSVNDGAMTTLVSDVEKESFGASGVGRSRMGSSGLLRFLRTKAILVQTGTPAVLSDFKEIPLP